MCSANLGSVLLLEDMVSSLFGSGCGRKERGDCSSEGLSAISSGFIYWLYDRFGSHLNWANLIIALVAIQ